MQQLPQLLWGSGCPKPLECHEQLAGAVLGNDACCCYCCCKIGRTIAIFYVAAHSSTLRLSSCTVRCQTTTTAADSAQVPLLRLLLCSLELCTATAAAGASCTIAVVAAVTTAAVLSQSLCTCSTAQSSMSLQQCCRCCLLTPLLWLLLLLQIATAALYSWSFISSSMALSSS